MKVNGSTVTFVYQETSEQPEVKTYTVRYDWGEAPSDRKLPTDSRAYRSVEQAMDAVDTTFTAGSTSNAQNGGLTGTWAFSGWDGGTLEGTTVVFRGTWQLYPGRRLCGRRFRRFFLRRWRRLQQHDDHQARSHHQARRHQGRNHYQARRQLRHGEHRPQRLHGHGQDR